MATTIVMPKMGYDMREGTVVRWYKQEGEEVARGEVIADIETDKATVEFEAYTGGVLHRRVAREGIPIPVGDAIAIIAEPGEAVEDASAGDGRSPGCGCRHRLSRQPLSPSPLRLPSVPMERSVLLPSPGGWQESGE